MTAGRWYRWCLLVPFLWQAALAPWSNGVAWRPFGLPFPMVWQMAGIVVTSAVLWAVYRLDATADAASTAETLPGAGKHDHKVMGDSHDDTRPGEAAP